MHKFIHRNQILVGGRYRFKKGQHVEIHISAADRETIEFYTQGGGFIKQMPKSDFLESYVLMSDEEEKTFDEYRPAIAFFDTGEDQGPGLTWQAWPCVANRSRWNGWAVPYFSRPVIDELFKRSYCTKYGGMDEHGANVTPILWIEDEGYFFDNNVPDFTQLSKIEVDGLNHYCIDGYCWDLLEPLDDNVKLFTQIFPFTNTGQETQTDEDLVKEAEKWRELQSFGEMVDIEMVDYMIGLENRGHVNWQQHQYILNWLHRWRNCNDA